MAESEKLQRLIAATALPVDALGRKVMRPGHIAGLDPDMVLPEAAACVEQESCTASIDGWSAARAALKMLSESIADIHDAVQATKIRRPIPGQVSHSGKIQHEVIVDPARVNEVRVAMFETFGRVARSTDKHAAAVDAALAQVEASIAQKIRNPKRDPHEAADVRRTVFSQEKEGDRFGFVVSLIEQGDIAGADAVLSVSPAASGITRQNADLLRELAANRLAKSEVAMRDGLKAVKAKLAEAQNLWGKQYAELLPAPLNDGSVDRKLQKLRAAGAQ